MRYVTLNMRKILTLEDVISMMVSIALEDDGIFQGEYPNSNHKSRLVRNMVNGMMDKFRTQPSFLVNQFDKYTDLKLRKVGDSLYFIDYWNDKRRIQPYEEFYSLSDI